MHCYQFRKLAILWATAASAMPRSPPLAGEKWTIESMRRLCNGNDTSCTWTFRINTHGEHADPTPAEYTVNSSSSAPASRAVGGPSIFGAFTVTSTWREVHGSEDAWTTLSVVDYGRGVLVYPAYKDKQIRGGEVVQPDQAYVPETIPA